ncbi:MAG: undecaprenyl-diphosphate phosphatase [Candidatus Omnitrophica bacterium]|nr:undecaprenyl-diphosphate phosphatase [Candidatus Omnitrophota bacterium]
MLKYILLGIIQGFTEFFPVSSSGHLVLAQKLLGISGEEISLSVVLHLGTVLSMLVFFHKDIIKALRSLRTLALIMVVTLITGIIGVSGKHFFEKLFTSPRLVSFALIFTGIILIAIRKFEKGRRENLFVSDAAALGLAQGLAIVPGISRAGMTISALLFMKVDRNTAFNFSFLASIPAVIGAAVLEAKEIGFALQGELKYFAAGFIFSFLFGLLALWLLKIILHRAKFHYFGYYCIFIAIVSLLLIR